MNPKIIYSDLSKYSFSVSGGDTSNSTTANLLNYLPSSLWNSSSGVKNQSLVITFPSVKSCNSIVIENHNLDLLGADVIKLQTADDVTFTTSLTDIHTITASTSAIYFAEFATVTKKYWRIFFNSANDLSDTPYIGNIFLDNKLEYESTQNFNYKKDDAEFNTIEVITLDGKIYTNQPYSGRLINNSNFSLQSESFRQKFITFINTVKGKLYPFYFVSHDGIIRYVLLESDYNPVTIKNYNLNDILNFNTKSLETLDKIIIIANILETEEIIENVS